MKPTVGRIVHYFAPGASGPVAAIVTWVWSDDCVNLNIFADQTANPIADPSPLKTSVIKRSDFVQGDVWDWPERVSEEPAKPTATEPAEPAAAAPSEAPSAEPAAAAN